MKSIKVMPNPEFKVYESKSSIESQKWRWTILILGKTVGASTEGYANREDCINNAKKLGENISTLIKNEKLK